MNRQNVRVVLAAEFPDVRYFLRKMVEQEKGTVIVGQAQDAKKALTLTRNLRPDVTIIDSYLPHIIGLDAVPLSRIGGLDTAQTIAEEIPNVRAVMVNNLQTRPLPEYGPTPDVEAFFTREGNGDTPFRLRELCQETNPLSLPIFAKVATKPRITPEPQSSTLIEKLLFFGGLGIAAGWLLILTMYLAPAGVLLVAAGAVAVLAGLVGKLVNSWRTK